VEWLAGGVDSLRGDEFGPTAAVESDMPSLAVHEHMMILAQQAHIANFRLTPVEPRNDMVRVAVAGCALAGRKGASLIPLAQCVAQGGRSQTLVAPDVQGHRVGAQDHGDDRRIAREAAGFGGR